MYHSQSTVSQQSSHSLRAPMIIPPDGGWGWIIVIVGILSGIIVDGVSVSFYLFREPMSKELEIDPAEISFVASEFLGFYFLGGILACSAGIHWGFRVVTIAGCLCLSISLATGCVLQEIIYYYIIVGFIGGFSAGFICVGCTLPVSFYFDRKRSLATGIVLCGSGIGTIILPQITQMFMKHYGWRLTFVFHGALIGFLTLTGFLIRPLDTVTVILKRASMATIVSHLPSTFKPQPRTSAATGVLNVIPSNTTIRTLVQHHTANPTITQIAHDANDNISIRVRHSLPRNTITRLNTLNQPRSNQTSSSYIGVVSIKEEKGGKRVPWYKCCCCRRNDSLPEGPLLRNDLYYTGSLHRLTEFTEKERDLDYHLEVTQVPNAYEVMRDLTSSYTKWCCHNILAGIQIILDYRLLKSLTFNCLVLNAFAQYMAFYLPYLYAHVHLEDMGHGAYATSIVSFIGLGNTFGRISSGIIVTAFPRFGARMTTVFTTGISGLAVIMATFHSNIIFQFVCMLIYGYAGGFFCPLRSIIVVDFFGLDQLTAAMGIIIFMSGLGTFLGAPVTEAIMKETQSVKTPFLISGSCLIFSSLILLPMKCLLKWEKKRKAKRRGSIRGRTHIV